MGYGERTQRRRLQVRIAHGQKRNVTLRSSSVPGRREQQRVSRQYFLEPELGTVSATWAPQWAHSRVVRTSDVPSPTSVLVPVARLRSAGGRLTTVLLHKSPVSFAALAPNVDPQACPQLDWSARRMASAGSTAAHRAPRDSEISAEPAPSASALLSNAIANQLALIGARLQGSRQIGRSRWALPDYMLPPCRRRRFRSDSALPKHRCGLHRDVPTSRRCS
jgi:hypothetical protein